MAEYGSMFAGQRPGGDPVLRRLERADPDLPRLGWAYEPSETAWRLAGYLANLAGCVNFIGKAVLGVTVMMWVRWTLPRLRIDQVMTMCLKYCVPLAAVCFVGVLAWQVLAWPSPNHLVRRPGSCGGARTVGGSAPGSRRRRRRPSSVAHRNGTAAAVDRVWQRPRPAPLWR